MQVPTNEELQMRLEDAYFDMLEMAGIKFLDYNQIGEATYEPVIKDEYRLTNDEMARELGFESYSEFCSSELQQGGITQPQWVKDWTTIMTTNKKVMGLWGERHVTAR